MKRRKAITSIFLLGGGVVASYSGFRLYKINKSPDLSQLEKHKLLIADLADVIIPRTDTPGAKDVHAEDTIILLVKKVSDKKTKNNFIDGLMDVKTYSISNYDKSFSQLTSSEKNEVVEHFYKKGKNFSGKLGKAKNKILGKSFFEILRQYTTIAYCTSKAGATQGLAYDYIPGKLIGCQPLLPKQKSWATK